MTNFRGKGGYGRLVVWGFTLRSFSVLFLALLIAPVSAFSEGVNGFFDTNVAEGIVKRRVVTHKPNLFTFLHDRSKPAEMKAAMPKKAVQKPEMKEVAKKAPIEEKELSKKEKILKEYGNPESDPEINVIDNAPKPFKAMMKALDAGEDELAFDFARQYVRYLDRHQQRVSRVTSLVGHAGEAEGVLNSNGWQKDELYGGERHLLDKYREKQEGADEKADVRTVDQRAAAVLADMKSRGEPTPEKPPVQLDEKAERMKVRAKLAGQVPVDPNGEVDILFFFGTRDDQSAAMFDQVNQLALLTKETENIDIVGLSLTPVPRDLLQKYSAEAKLNFPLIEGGEMARKLKVKRGPTVVFVARNTGKAVYQEGFRPAFYLDEVRKAVQGIGARRQ